MNIRKMVEVININHPNRVTRIVRILTKKRIYAQKYGKKIRGGNEKLKIKRIHNKFEYKNKTYDLIFTEIKKSR